MHPADGRLNRSRAAPAEMAHLQTAVDWYLTLNDPDVQPEQRAAWQQWLAASPQHASAWSRVERVQHRLSGVPVDVALPVLNKMGLQRRQSLKLLLLLAAGGTGLGVYHTSPYSADYATRTGERRQVLLADGSQLLLNTGSRIDISFTASQRQVMLRQGEIAITTARDPASSRPFSVLTRHGQILALGTRFNVRLYDSHTQVSVQQHAVQVQPDQARQQVQRIDAGQVLTFTASAAGSPVQASSEATAWTQGKLITIEWRLEDLINELARYRPGYLGCAPEVAELKVTGAFVLADTDAVLANLQSSLPIRLRTFSRYWVRIEA